MECSVCEKGRILIDFFVQQANDIVEYEHGFLANSWKRISDWNIR